MLRTAGVLVRLKEAGAIERVAPYLDRLETSDFRLSAKARLEILRAANELDEP